MNMIGYHTHNRIHYIAKVDDISDVIKVPNNLTVNYSKEAYASQT